MLTSTVLRHSGLCRPNGARMRVLPEGASSQTFTVTTHPLKRYGSVTIVVTFPVPRRSQQSG